MRPTADVQQMKLQELRTMQRELKKAHAHVRTILRVKVLIAVYKGMDPEVVAECYEISLKSLKKWMKQFEADEDLADHARSGRPPKLSPEQAQQLKALITPHNQRAGPRAMSMSSSPCCGRSAILSAISPNCCAS